MVARDELQAFDERRYLHQTMVRRAGQTPAFYEDLPLALAVETWSAPAEWRDIFTCLFSWNALAGCKPVNVRSWNSSTSGKQWMTHRLTSR